MQQLLADIDRAPAISPTLWWLGRAGFAIKYHHMVFYVDPFDSPLLDPAQANHAQMLLATSAAPAHMDLTALKAMLAASPEAKLVLPKSTAEFAKTNGIGYERMTTTDNGLRVEYFGMGDYIRVYAVPSARLEAAPAPFANNSGATPSRNANEVIRIGRSRRLAASIADS